MQRVFYEPGYDYTALVRTDKGDFTMKLFDQEVHETVAAFIAYVNYGHYENAVINNVVPDRIVYVGDITGFGMGKVGENIRGQFSQREFVAGTVGMVRQPENPDSATGAFFITLVPHPSIKGKYSAFAQVTQGLELLTELSHLPTLGGPVGEWTSNRPVNPPKILEIKFSRTPRELTEAEKARVAAEKAEAERAAAEMAGQQHDH